MCSTIYQNIDKKDFNVLLLLLEMHLERIIRSNNQNWVNHTRLRTYVMHKWIELKYTRCIEVIMLIDFDQYIQHYIEWINTLFAVNG